MDNNNLNDIEIIDLGHEAENQVSEEATGVGVSEAAFADISENTPEAIPEAVKEEPVHKSKPSRSGKRPLRIKKKLSVLFSEKPWTKWVFAGAGVLVTGLLGWFIYGEIRAFKITEEIYSDAENKQQDADSMISSVVNKNSVVDEETVKISLDEIMSQADFESRQEILEEAGQTYGDYLEEQKGLKEHLTDELLYERVDFENLENVILEEVDGWLFIPGTNVDYVVMHGNEEEPYKYLWKDPHGNKSSTGSLFIKYEADAEEKDDHRLIYGHRLKDHSLYFGALLNYRDEAYAREHAVAYYYGRNRVTRYNLYSVNEGLETDAVYLYPYTISTPDYQWLIDDINKYTTIKVSETEYNPARRMMVLSTCSGDMGGMPNRLYLVFEEDCYWNYGGKPTVDYDKSNL